MVATKVILREFASSGEKGKGFPQKKRSKGEGWGWPMEPWFLLDPLISLILDKFNIMLVILFRLTHVHSFQIFLCLFALKVACLCFLVWLGFCIVVGISDSHYILTRRNYLAFDIFFQYSLVSLHSMEFPHCAGWFTCTGQFVWSRSAWEQLSVR